MSDATCSEGDCTSPVFARGLCQRDWRRRKRLGTLPELNRYLPVEERFWSRVDRRETGECWPWLWGCNGAGYGNFFVRPGEFGLARGQVLLAHRVGFRLVHGHWPEPMGLHGCDNPPCCNVFNPEHVHEGDNSLNMQEKFARGRQGRHQHGGESHARAKLTNEQVREIRALHAKFGVSYAQLGREYGVSKENISLIVRRQTFRAVI